MVFLLVDPFSWNQSAFVINCREKKFVATYKMLILVGATLVLSHEQSRATLENVITELAPIAADHLFLLLLSTVVLSLVAFLASRVSKKKSSSNATEKKQGAYGAVQTHGHSVWDQISRPGEVAAACHLLYEKKFSKAGKGVATKLHEELWDHLNKTSRSFAAVIRILPAPDVSDAVCVFYLLLRALDTIEDEMDLEKFEEFKKEGETPLEAKVRLLCEFHNLLDTDESKIHTFPLEQVLKSRIGAAAERALLLAVPRLIEGFHQVKQGTVIKNIVRDMGKGMSEYVVRDMHLGTRDEIDYDRYCHIVAGLVGKGLTEIFCNLGYEDESLINDFAAWNSMGLLLQRTNITRDVCEDAAEGRSWWPQSIWQSGEQAATELGSLRDISILNKMVCNALQLIPEATRYLDRLSDPSIFGFCALPQIMAVATLAVCYNNPNVFTGVVKIRQGQAAKLALSLRGRTIVSARKNYKREAALLVDEIRVTALGAGDADTVACCERALEALGMTKKQRKNLITTTNAQIAFYYLVFLVLGWMARNYVTVAASAMKRIEMLAGGDAGLMIGYSMAGACLVGASVIGMAKQTLLHVKS